MYTYGNLLALKHGGGSFGSLGGDEQLYKEVNKIYNIQYE